jgi:tRNA threonylcarbamoyladenosine biosynthesis protein TsaB
MLTITIRTDKPEAEIGLFDADQKLEYKTWQAHRQLAETLLRELEALLQRHGKSINDVQAIIAYRGPGSFTGLRIGLTVANTLAYSLNIPIVGAEGEDWHNQGMDRLKRGETEHSVVPEYGSAPHITAQKH